MSQTVKQRQFLRDYVKSKDRVIQDDKPESRIGVVIAAACVIAAPFVIWLLGAIWNSI